MIEIDGLTKYFGERKGVGPLTFDIDKGEIIGLLGLNGAGKTTTLRMLASDLLPTAGRIVVDGVDLVAEPEKVRPKIGYLPDRTPLYEEMEVREFLYFAARLRGLGLDGLSKRVEEVIERTWLQQEANTRISMLSHGYKRRVGIAQAIVHQPTLLLLDEPISGLDPKQIKEMRNLVRSLRGDHTIVISSHILSEISETCDRLLVIRDGEIVAVGTEEQLANELAVGATMVVEMTLRASETSATKLLKQLPHVHSVTPLPAEEDGDDVCTLRIKTDQDIRERLCAELVRADIGILQLTHSAAGELEDVFLHLTAAKPHLKPESKTPRAPQEEA